MVDIGLCGTEEVYFATFHLKLDGGIMVTASHNPSEYNGMKLVRNRPSHQLETGLQEIARLVTEERFEDKAERPGEVKGSTSAAYVSHLMGYVESERLRPLRIACNPGNGTAASYSST